MGASRFILVALPLLLTTASIIALLYATLAGVTHHNTFMFKINTTDATVDKNTLQQVAKTLGIDLNKIGKDFGVDANSLLSQALNNGNVTAKQVGLDYVFDIGLWGYCYTKDERRDCTKPQFDWATQALNETLLQDVGAAAGIDASIPKEVRQPLKAFRTAIKFTEIAFIVALVLLGLELLLGIFAIFSRVASCFTWLIACLSTMLVFVAAGLATGVSAAVVGAVASLSMGFDIKGSIYTSFLVAIWAAVGLALAAKLFWILTICCCKPINRRSRHRNSYDDMEKPIASRGYAPLSPENAGFNNLQQYDNHTPDNFQQYPARDDTYNSSFGLTARFNVDHNRPDLVYEPYSQRY